MLLKVLQCLSDKGNFSTSFISREIGVPAPIVEDIKDKLISMGYIAKVSCDTSMCEGCSCGCNTIKLNDKVDWDITKKGHELLNKKGR